MKSKTVIAAAALAVAATLAGCDKSETTLLAAANTAGNLALSTWFAIEEPDGQVKTALKEIVAVTVDASAKIGGGESYVNALTPVVQEIASSYTGITPAQRNLVNVGASVILSGIDTYIDSNERLRTNAELASKVVAEFGKGCLTALERSENSPAAQSIRQAHRVMSLRYDVEANAFRPL